MDELNKSEREISLIYKKMESEDNIFGKRFVENNKDNIDLIINEEKSKLVSKCKLKEGENIIRIIIKSKLRNLAYMFYECKSLIDISKLEYIETNEVNNFSYMFSGCKSLSDIKSLENWNVSNGNDFSDMFSFCSSLSNIKPLENWNISNGNDFGSMFRGLEFIKINFCKICKIFVKYVKFLYTQSPIPI